MVAESDDLESLISVNYSSFSVGEVRLFEGSDYENEEDNSNMMEWYYYFNFIWLINQTSQVPSSTNSSTSITLKLEANPNRLINNLSKSHLRNCQQISSALKLDKH